MILITGGNGKLGKALRDIFPDALTPGRDTLNVLDKNSVDNFFKDKKFDLVIHAAAYTSVTKAETEKELCWNTNVRGTEYLVDALKRTNPQTHFTYISTACVFYGDRGMYTEDDIPHPKNFYAITKLVGEYIVRRLEQRLIVRTNFVAREPWPYPRAFTDRFGTYLYADQVAKKINELTSENKQGLIHIAGDTKMSMFDLAKRTSPEIAPMTMQDTKDPLTIDMTLKSNRIHAVPFLSP